MQSEQSERHDLASNISAHDFLKVGLNQVGYIKPVIVDDQEAFAVFAANGKQIMVSDTYVSALGAMYQNDLHAVSLN